MSSMNQKKIGKFLAQLRIEKGLTQEELAKVLFTDRTMISKWERGVYMPNHEYIISISKFFDISINEIYYGEKETKGNKQKINEVPIKIMKDGYKKRKRILIASICILLLLSIAFLFYYFITTYKSISVYKITGEGENFYLYDGIIVVSREKCYIQLGTIRYLNNLEPSNIKLFYKQNGKEIPIFSDLDRPQLFTNNFNLSQSFSYQDIKQIKENLYIGITFTNGQSETLKLNVNRDFINDDILDNNTSFVDNEPDNSNSDFPTYILTNFSYNSEKDYYFLETKKENKTILQIYYDKASLYVVEENNGTSTDHYEYFLPDDIYYCNSENSNDYSQYVISTSSCSSNNCNLEKINYFINTYVNYLKED